MTISWSYPNLCYNEVCYKGTALYIQGLPCLRICCSQHFSQMERVGAK